MKTKRNPEADVAKILDIDQFLNPRKDLKRWLVVVFLVTATLITLVVGLFELRSG